MAAAPNQEITQLAEFPDRFSPVFVKELRQGLRANYFVLPFIGTQILAIFAIVVEVVLGHFGTGSGAGVILSGGVFFPFLWVVFFVVMPLTLFGALQPEISAGRNVELLLMSNLTRWQIVRGKFLVGCVLSCLMMISLLPYLLIRYFVGNVELVSSVEHALILMFGNALMNAIVVGSSGIRSYVGRVFMIGFIFCSFFVAALISVSVSSTVAGILGFLCALGVTSLLYIILSLQFGRAKLRVFENPLDPPPTALIVVMIVLSPLATGMTMGLFGIAGGVGSSVAGMLVIAGLVVLALLLDRGPGKNSAIRWAQP